MIDANLLSFLESQTVITNVIPVTSIYNGKPQNEDTQGDGYLYFNVRNTSYDICTDNFIVDLVLSHKNRSTMLQTSEDIAKLFKENNLLAGGKFFHGSFVLGLIKSTEKLNGGFYWANMIIQLSIES